MTSAARKTVEVGNEVFADELKPGTQLLHGQFTIESFLNSGGFGITYLARDSLDRLVVIKECFPGTFCRRSKTIVGARSRAHQVEFRSIVKLFVQEAFNLSKLKHPHIVGVHQVFEDNETAYMAMDYIEGFDLLETLEEGATRLTPDEIVGVLKKVLEAVGYVHSKGVLHRDISPDNILMDKKTGNPVLIDFGAAREEVSRVSRALSAMRVVKDGYSPQEFYIKGSAQGPYSDLYALAATFYHLITGDTPTNSQSRLSAVASRDPDPYVPLSGNVKGYPPAFLKAIDKAMSVFPKDRIQTADAWLAMIACDSAEIGERAEKSTRRVVSESVAVARARASWLPRLASMAAGGVLLAGLGVWQLGLLSQHGDDQVASVETIVPISAQASGATSAADTEPAGEATAEPVPTEMVGDATDAAGIPDTAQSESPASAGAPGSEIQAAADPLSIPEAAPMEEDSSVAGPSVPRFTLTRAVSMPFGNDVVQTNLITSISQGAPMWMQPGQRIVELNGVPVRSSSDLREIMGRGRDLVGQSAVEVVFGVQAFEGADTIRKVEAIPVVDFLVLDTGLAFEIRGSEAGSQTVVSFVPMGAVTNLKAGDVLVSHTGTLTKIDAATPLSAILLREIEKKVVSYGFAVQREGRMFAASFALAPAN